VSNCTRFVVVSLLASSALAWRAGGAAAQGPSGAVVTPTPGATAPRVIATSRPVNDVEPAKPAAVLPGHTQETGLPAVPHVAPADGGVAPEGLRLVGAGPPGAAPPGACLIVERAAPAQVAAGKPLAYEIIVRNVGAAEAQRVRVEEQLPAGAVVIAAEPHAEAHGLVLAWDVGALAPGAESRLRVTIQPAGEGDVSATATVTSAVSSTLHARVVGSGLSLKVTDSPPVKAGQKVIFQIQIANNTSAPLSRLLLRAKLSAELKHPQGQMIEAVIPALSPGEVKSVPLEVTAVKAGRATLTASLMVAGSDPKTAEGAVEVTEVAAPAPVPAVVTGSPEVKPPAVAPPVPAPEKKSPPPAIVTPPPAPEKNKNAVPAPDLLLPPPPPPDLDVPKPQGSAAPPGSVGKPIASAGGPAVTLDLADADAALEVGGETTYEIRVLNQGATPTRDVLVKAVVPDEMTLVRADGPGGQPAQVQGQEVAFGPLPSLDGQGRAVYRVRVKALKPGDGRFTARLQCGEMARPLSQEVSTRVYGDAAPAAGSTQK
jgi:uncharacterized repeat protein (TIGR01451 family)